MKKIAVIFLFLALIPTVFSHADKLPNIVYILADDMGQGDLACYNPESKIPTPNIDQLARDGMRFTDIHSGSAVCTPTRYDIITGRYSWRSTMLESVTFGYSPPIIPSDRMTVADVARQAGYSTACVGKWHLGWDWQAEEGKSVAKGEVDYTSPIKNGPIDLGFDYYFGIPASLDMPPYVYVENDRVTAAPDAVIAGRTGKELLREGPISPDFKPEEVMDKFLEKSLSFIEKHLQSNKEKPFFLYLPLAAPHTPILPTAPFIGKSKAGTYGDFVYQVDWVVGEILKTLEKNGLAENTLIIFTADNGAAPASDFEELRGYGHDSNNGLRGHKADIFEGGHRVPFIAKWSGHIATDTVNEKLFWLGDLMATVAELTNITLPENAGEDSWSFLSALTGQEQVTPRPPVVHQSANGSLAIRELDWKLVFCDSSGGWSNPTPKQTYNNNFPPVQLYNLREDLEEKNNIYEKHPEIVKSLSDKMKNILANGRSTPGASQENDSNDATIWGPAGRNKPKDIPAPLE